MIKHPWTKDEVAKLKALIAKGGLTQAQIAAQLGRTFKSVRARIENIDAPIANAGDVSQSETAIPTTQIPIELPKPSFGYLPLGVIDSGEWIQYGLLGDTHLCCKEERLAELHNYYDLLEREGITAASRRSATLLPTNPAAPVMKYFLLMQQSDLVTPNLPSEP